MKAERQISPTKDKCIFCARQTKRLTCTQPLTPHTNLRYLHTTLGNNTIRQLANKGMLQTKLKISKTNDKYEQEANYIADQVVNKSNVQHKNPKGSRQTTQTTRFTKINTPMSTEYTDIPPIVNEVLHSSGRQLDPGINRFMEEKLGYDFSSVRIHTEEKAGKSADCIKALAYTVGNNIIFGTGRYAPHMANGLHLIAHELAHVLQQSYGLEHCKKVTSCNNPSQQDEKLIQRQSLKTTAKAGAKPTLNMLQEKYGQGIFLQFVTKGNLDSDVALLLNYMSLAPWPTWVHDTAEFAFQELNNGNLVGIVKWADRRKLIAKLNRKFHADILNAKDSSGGAEYAPLNKMKRGRILIGSLMLANRNTPVRKPLLMLTHELSHHRVRKIAEFIRKEPRANVTNRNEYVNLQAASKISNMPNVRKTFVVEVVARHVAWHVAQLYDTKVAKTQKFSRHMPKHGALFNNLVDFSLGGFSQYDPGGYFKEVAKKGVPAVGKQVAMWMIHCARMDFHGLATTSDAIGRFFIQEAERAKKNRYKKFNTPSDGLA